MSDDAVKAKTGKIWKEWFAILDKAGAAKMPHKEIAEYLYKKQGVPDWWCQMVTVTYEQARGLRKVHQKPDGFEVSASKTIEIPVGKLYDWWHEQKLRSRWFLGEKFDISSTTKPKVINLKWVDGFSRVIIAFYPKGKSKSQVTIQHSKLKKESDVPRMKKYWKNALERLIKEIEA